MTRLRYSVAATLDGFIADPDGGDRITGMKLDKCETLPKSGIVMRSYTIPHK
jgi:hypothetical protein